MRAILGCGLAVVLVLAATAGAEDKKGEKIDGKKLVGKWAPKGLPEGVKVLVEFTADGKASMSSEFGDKKDKTEGTYKLDGNKLTLTKKVGDKDEAKMMTVTKLTDEEMVMKNDKEAKETTLVRVK